MFIHQAGPQALVQYSHLYDCIRAKGELEKTTFMYNNRRYSFEVQYSKLKELVIHKNNNYSRDFRLFPMDLDGKSWNSSAYPSSMAGYPVEESSLFAYSQQDSYYNETDSLSTSSQSSPRFYNPVLPSKRLGDGPLSLFSPSDSYYSMAQPYECGRFNSLMQGGLAHPSLQSKAFHRRDSDYSLLSSTSSACGDSLSPFGCEPDPFQSASSLFRSGSLNTRKYILDGFTEMMPISDIVDFLYGINVKYAEYKKNLHQYSIIIYGVSEWSDAMLVSYLHNNPVNGNCISLRCPSEPVSNY